MVNPSINALRIFICVVLTVQLTGCGTLLYPERKGQRSGKIDAGVAVLDGIGLLLFIIPGLVAFAIDFNNGTIYLPGTSSSSLDLKNIEQVKFDHKNHNKENIERAILMHTGYSIKLDQSNMRVAQLKSLDDMIVQFSRVQPEIQDDRMAMMRSVSNQK